MTFPVLKRTLAIFLSPEFGFLGFVVPTFKHTPFNSGLFFNCGDRNFRALCDILPCRRTCINVHLFARDAGVICGCLGKALRHTEVAIEGIGACKGAVAGTVSSEGRTSRLKNVRDMVGVLCVY